MSDAGLVVAALCGIWLAVAVVVAAAISAVFRFVRKRDEAAAAAWDRHVAEAVAATLESVPDFQLWEAECGSDPHD